MKKNKSLHIYAILNVVKTLLVIIYPIITYPYVFRVLKVNAIGKYNYATSIISYFNIFASLGLSTYAIREGAKLKDNQEKFHHFTNLLFSFNLITSSTSIVLLLIAINAFQGLEAYSEILFIMSFTILFSTIGVEWINNIFEDYIFITIRTLTIQIINIICLFVFVKSENDILSYAFINTAAAFLISISNLIHCRKYVQLRFIGLKKIIEIKNHLKAIMLLFANSLATTIYVNSDLTMIGIWLNDYYVGIYSLAVKIYGVVKNLLAASFSVVIPRLSNYYCENNIKGFKNLVSNVISELMIFLLPASIGLLFLSKEIVLLVVGNEYLESVISLQILSISLIGAIFGGIFVYCINLPIGKEEISFQATVMSAILNISLNIIMIPLLKISGAAITTLISEFFVLVYCIAKTKKLSQYIDTKRIKKSFVDSLIGCLIVILCSIIIKAIIIENLWRLIIIPFMSITLYFIILIKKKNVLVESIIRRNKKERNNISSVQSQK